MKHNNSVITFNIRYDCKQDGALNWENRKEFVFETLAEYAPAILCLQEVLPHVKDAFDRRFPSYHFCGCGRSKDLQDEYNPIGYRADLFDLLYARTFWLSDTPTIAGSLNPYSVDLPRICTHIILKYKDSDQLLQVFNTHLDHMSTKARIFGLETIFSQMNAFQGIPTILTGDFNAQPDSDELRFAYSNPFQLTDRSITDQITYREFTSGSNAGSNSATTEKAAKIDYIFCSADIDCTSFSVCTRTKNGLELSDHYPCIAAISL